MSYAFIGYLSEISKRAFDLHQVLQRQRRIRELVIGLVDDNVYERHLPVATSLAAIELE